MLDTPWILRRAPRPSPTLRLVCIPNAGRGASMYSPWSAELPERIEVCAVQLPGRENRLGDPPEPSVAALVPKLADALAPIWEGAYAIYGHSVGALIGFELVRELRRRGARPPVHLAVSGRRAPQRAPLPPMAHLDHRELLAALTQMYGPMPAVILADPDFLALALDIIRADLRLSEGHTYIEEPPLAVPLSAYGGLRDGATDEAMIRDWSAHTSAAFRWRMFDGDHFFPDARRADVVRALLEDLAPVMQVR